MTSILDDFRDVIAARTPLAGRRVLDVGCGDGAFVRELAAAGAVPTGLECSLAQLAMCREATPVGAEAYVSGVGESLPFADDRFDATVFRASLHHVPEGLMTRALREARRVTRPGGDLFVFEPLTTGTHFRLTRLFNDETVVRRLAQEAIDQALAQGFVSRVGSVTLESEAFYRDFEALRRRVLAIDGSRAGVFTAVEPELRRVFATGEARGETGRAFSQPFRLDILN